MGVVESAVVKSVNVKSTLPEGVPCERGERHPSILICLFGARILVPDSFHGVLEICKQGLVYLEYGGRSHPSRLRAYQFPLTFAQSIFHLLPP